MLEVETPEELLDSTLLGNRLERYINRFVPNFIIGKVKEKGCNCNHRVQLLNEWHLSYREYKLNIKELKVE